MRLARLKNCLAIALPERGMPIIVSQFDDVGDDPSGWEAILTRGQRVNGMDQMPPSSVYLPTGGMGFFGWPAIEGHRNGTHFILEPTSWQVEEGQSTLALTGRDPVSGIELRIHFTEINGLIMQTNLRNLGSTPYTLNRCMAGSLLISQGVETITSFRGKWGQEFQEEMEPAGKALWLLESRKGRTSHDRYPAIVVQNGAGTSIAAHLGWSGNHVIALDRLDDGQSLLHLGELFEPGEMILAPGETYHSPRIYAAQDRGGDKTELALSFHSMLRQAVLKWPSGKMKPRPVLLNTWEGNYFKHDVTRLQQQASAAAALGIERFVLDDGWFGKRDDDTSSLGDWFIDARKYPQGLKPLVDHVTALGMEFGLWFEPEMINVNSDLYRQHPDWVLQAKGRPLLDSRHQQVLDLTRPEVSDYLFACMDAVLKTHRISYIKWDMNRDLTHAAGADGRPKTAAQTRAVYTLMQRIRDAHPAVEIESCASGGGRADYGALQYTQRVWISDCTDALERLTIQKGAARFLVPEIMGCHISASPNHQTGRRHSLAFRAITAFFGHLGVELDPLALTPEQRDELKGWIALHKELRPILHAPDAEWIDLPVVDGRHVFGVTLRDSDLKTEHMIVAVAQATHPKTEQPMPLRLPTYYGTGPFAIREIGPVPAGFARISEAQRALLKGEPAIGSDLLWSHGIPLPHLYPESAILLEIKTVGAKHG